MSKQAITFHKFATNKALDGRFSDVADVRKHYSEMQYHSWITIAQIEYHQYLTESFPEMTLAQAAKLKLGAPA